tara:strand:+ start:3412 stop:3642 length:231 start_codon:yes stop_codon:yes gene_type:complete
MMKLPIKDNEGWQKDLESGAIDLSHSASYKKYMAAHKAEKDEKEKMEALQNDVSNLKSDMSEIKSLLLTLVQDQKG